MPRVDPALPARRPPFERPGAVPHALSAGLRSALEERPRAPLSPLGAIEAAVLVGLFEGHDGEPRVWLMRRPDTLRTHSGQVALPGGKRDPGDLDIVSTALREAEEEIGLSPRLVEVLGVADDLVTGTGFVITPVVGWIQGPFEPRPNPTEVSRVFSAPFATFRNRVVLEPMLIPSARAAMVGAFRVEGEVVWGATAAILSALSARVGGR
jgi:8-oxo-dGTP pyrophosphatase MutT (NUDIX family)